MGFYLFLFSFCLEKGQWTKTKDQNSAEEISVFYLLSGACLPLFSFSLWNISQGLYTRRCGVLTFNLICKCHAERNNKVRNESVNPLKLINHGEMGRKRWPQRQRDRPCTLFSDPWNSIFNSNNKFHNSPRSYHLCQGTRREMKICEVEYTAIPLSFFF